MVRLCAVDTPRDPPFPGVEADLCRHDYAGVPILGNLRASKSLQSLLAEIVPDAAVVHVHGIWLMPNVYAGQAASRFRRPLIVSPRGMLAPEALRFSRMRKLAFWNAFQRQAYAAAAVWHATCDAEADEIRAFGIRGPVAIIPNGVDVMPATPAPDRPLAPSRIILYLGRIHPKKGLPSLVKAWAQVAAEFPEWRLRIAGPDEAGHGAELAALADRLGAVRFSLEPALFGSPKDEALLDASVFVLPTLNENFGIAVAEALAAGVPAIVTRGAPWSGLETERCGWWIDQGIAPMADALRAAMRLAPSDLQAMGKRGRAWVSRDFSWAGISRDMIAVYSWAVHGGSPPATVRLN